MTNLTREIESFERMRPELERQHSQKWAVFHEGALVDVYDDFQTAAAESEERFETGPYLIRQIGAPTAIHLSGGMIFTPFHAHHSGRL